MASWQNYAGFCLLKRHLLTFSPSKMTRIQCLVHLVRRHESVCLLIVFPCQHRCILCVWHLYGIKWVMERAICVWNILWAGCNLGTPKLLGTLVGNFMWAPESLDWDTMHVGRVLQTFLGTVSENLQHCVNLFEVNTPKYEISWKKWGPRVEIFR